MPVSLPAAHSGGLRPLIGLNRHVTLLMFRERVSVFMTEITFPILLGVDRRNRKIMRVFLACWCALLFGGARQPARQKG
jgi:hypothetical protein